MKAANIPLFPSEVHDIIFLIYLVIFILNADIFLILVHLNGAFTNEQCTIRIGLGRPKQVLVASVIAEAKQLLTNRTASI